jgi:hypothetical protein
LEVRKFHSYVVDVCAIAEPIPRPHSGTASGSPPAVGSAP